ncbi:hypothetical protein C4D60_Mb10t14030 [Musa balbisiana]|uniref:Uncharacterized protein n=1 Tax=Musa balbisiana TaxID=52838 RepID=A0A4S8IZF0_MUSBA|nr:hypothetical protein C4D60_Mb10t14030 [Musa balbisiana]
MAIIVMWRSFMSRVIVAVEVVCSNDFASTTQLVSVACFKQAITEMMNESRGDPHHYLLNQVLEGRDCTQLDKDLVKGKIRIGIFCTGQSTLTINF